MSFSEKMILIGRMSAQVPMNMSMKNNFDIKPKSNAQLHSFSNHWMHDDILSLHTSCHLLAMGESIVQRHRQLHKPLGRVTNLHQSAADFVLHGNRWCSGYSSWLESIGEGKSKNRINQSQ